MFLNRQTASLGDPSSQLSYVRDIFFKTLDFIRTWILRRTLKIPLLRKIYSSTALRLSVTFVFSCLFNLTIAFVRPDFLLVFGPLVYGYFHLIASYYFIQPTNNIKESDQESRKKIQIFCLFTGVAIAIRAFIASLGPSAELPNGAWEMIAATGIFIYYLLNTKLLSKKYIFIMIALNILILRLVWYHPLNFVSATLFLHNWIAFFYWIFLAKNKTNRITAIGATIVFAIIHALVMAGYCDHLFTFQSQGSLLAANIDGTSWILSPWSDNPIIGQRALVLYTFGLSLHYFIWLKAIPENRQTQETPNSFTRGFQIIQNNIGRKEMFFLMSLVILGILIWLYSFKVGAAIYFTIATLHIWLEPIFLIPRLSIKKN